MIISLPSHWFLYIPAYYEYKFRTTESIPAETIAAIMGRGIINPEKRYLSDKFCIFALVI